MSRLTYKKLGISGASPSYTITKGNFFELLRAWKSSKVIQIRRNENGKTLERQKILKLQKT